MCNEYEMCFVCVQQTEIDSIHMNLLAALQHGTVTNCTQSLIHRQMSLAYSDDLVNIKWKVSICIYTHLNF